MNGQPFPVPCMPHPIPVLPSPTLDVAQPRGQGTVIRHCSKAHTQLAESHRSDGEENNILFTASPETSLRAALPAAKCSPEHHHRLLTSLPARPSPRAAGGRIPPASGCSSPRMLAAGTSCGAGSASGCDGRGHIASPLASTLRDGREAPRSCCPAALPREPVLLKGTLPPRFTFLLKTSGLLGTYAPVNIAHHLARGHGATATDGYEHRQPRDLVSASSVFAKGRIRSQKCQNG